MRPILEICAADIVSVQAAKEGGADRVELCSGLSTGGLTPSMGVVEAALALGGVKVNLLIRCREGDYCYSAAEVSVMLRDIERFAALSVNGLVVGALRGDGEIDESVCAEMMSAAQGVPLTFHRALDVCADPLKAVGRLAELGFKKVLTSGGALTAERGLHMIAQMRALAADRLSVMPGSGVNGDNAADILIATGCREIHASASHLVHSRMNYRGPLGSFNYKQTAVAAVKNIVDNIRNL
jgi:copper homeostasis protein